MYPRLLENEKHYYYIDSNNREWQFLEINGTKNNYYFKCSTKLCKAFAIIPKKIQIN